MVTDIISALFIFISALISMSVLGLIAGFSPTLYVAQIAMASKSKHAIAYTAALMTGVFVAILILIILFQAIHLETLLGFITSTVRAVTVSVIFNLLIGIGFVWGGIWYIRAQDATPKEKAPTLKKTGGIVSMASLGFARTFISVSGVTATYIAGNIIANISIGLAERAVYTLMFFAASIIPFAAITFYMHRNPGKLSRATARMRKLLEQFNYRLIVGVTAVILGGSIVIFNLMMALLY